MPALRFVIGSILLVGVLAYLALTFRRWWKEARQAIAIRGAAKQASTREARTPTDPRKLFSHGEQLGDATIRIDSIAHLHLPTGKIVGCDPLVFPDEPPFERAIAPGDYPVDIAIAQLPDQHRVAAVRIVFAPGTPATFVSTGSYGVDAGVGCFMDEQTASLLESAMSTSVGEHGNYYDDVLANELGDGDWVDHRPVRDRKDNVVIVHSGWGDGMYESYWGLDEAGEPLWLVTDFEVA